MCSLSVSSGGSGCLPRIRHRRESCGRKRTRHRPFDPGVWICESQEHLKPPPRQNAKYSTDKANRRLASGGMGVGGKGHSSLQGPRCSGGVMLRERSWEGKRENHGCRKGYFCPFPNIPSQMNTGLGFKAGFNRLRGHKNLATLGGGTDF